LRFESGGFKLSLKLLSIGMWSCDFSQGTQSLDILLDRTWCSRLFTMSGLLF
jgi:hypothetical protein